MKKIITILITFLCFIGIVDAAGLNVSVTCPTTASASETISCSVSATPTTSWPACAFVMKYTLSGGITYDSITTNSNLTGSTSSNGVVLSATTCFSGSTSIGTVKFKMPTSGTATILFYDLETTDDLGNNVASASNITKTIRVKSTVNTLSSLSLSSGTLSPSFSAETTSYTATVDASSVTVNATKTDSNSSVTGDGTKTLNYGTNTISVVVTSESGAKKTYTIVITRPDNRETVNTLSALSLSNGTLSPVFSSSTTSYTASVAPNITKVTLTATKASAKSSFVNGYGSRDINLEYGSNKILVKVLSENEKEKIYTITVTRQDNRSTNNYLKSLSLSEGTITFNKSTLEYAVTVDYKIDKITITGAVEDTKSTVTGLGQKALNVGSNVLNVVVTAENTTTKTYKITVNRLSENESPNSNTNLKTFTIENHDIEFDNETSDYEVKLGEDEDKLDLSYEADNSNATVVVTGNENLKNGSIVIVKVTATDGTIKEYKIKIVKPTNGNDTIVNTTTKNGTKLSLGLIIGIISIIVILAVIIVFLIIKKKRKDKYDSTKVEEIINIE